VRNAQRAERGSSAIARMSARGACAARKSSTTTTSARPARGCTRTIARRGTPQVAQTLVGSGRVRARDRASHAATSRAR
jgi:hypothetical protein